MILLTFSKPITRDYILDMVKQIVLTEIEDKPVVVYLFGSFARGEERLTSDIDVAIWYDQPLPPGTLTKISLRLEESVVPYRVDIVDLTQADQILLNRVQREGIVWKDYQNG
jgi:hypothetical protein